MKKLLSILVLLLCSCSSKLKVKVYPDPILFEKCAEVEIGDKSAVVLLDKMIAIMHTSERGAGLSAPQVGISKRITVLDIPENPRDPKSPSNIYKMINPVIVWRSEEFAPSPEGCFSVSDALGAIVMRHASVSVEYLNEKFEKCRIEKATGLLSFCLQHEIDHLDGILYINRLDPKKVYKVMLIDEVREKVQKQGYLSECIFIDKSNPKGYSEGIRILNGIKKNGLLNLQMDGIQADNNKER